MEYSNDNLEWTSGHFSSLSDNVHPNPMHQISALKSYPPSSHTLGPESNVSSHHGSLNTLQISIIALKDRCLKQQRKIDLLEDENSRLYYALGVSDLPQKQEVVKNDSANNEQTEHLEALNRLQEANFLLRQRNLELNQKLMKCSSDSSIKCKCQRKDHLDNEKSLKRSDGVTNNIGRKSKTTANVNGEIGADSDVEDHQNQDQSGDEIDNYSRKECNKSYDRVHLTEQNMQELKLQLLNQQKLMLAVVKNMATSLSTKSENLNHNLRIDVENQESTAQQTINSSVHKSRHPNHLEIQEANAILNADEHENERLCPMCEANFPQDLILQEDFEAHVLGHFSYESEAETLTNYDMVMDAQRAMDGDL